MQQIYCVIYNVVKVAGVYCLYRFVNGKTIRFGNGTKASSLYRSRLFYKPINSLRNFNGHFMGLIFMECVLNFTDRPRNKLFFQTYISNVYLIHVVDTLSFAS